METSEILNSIGLILFAATFTQWLSWQLKIPAIVFLTIAGLLMGPVFHLVDPEHLCGHLFHIIIEFAVVILLFEGGLNLRLRELKGVSFGIKRLITLGILINGLLIAAASHYIGGLDWKISAIIGSILVVTGPTVIIPVLRQANLPKRINQYLKWEAIINDPLGVLIVAIVYQYITYEGSKLLTDVILISFAKAILFTLFIVFALGASIKYLFDKTRFPDFLKIPTILSTILLVFIISKQVQDGSGLLAVTLLGMYFANKRMLVLADLRKFKESVSVFSVSLVFILLSASIDFKILQMLSLRHVTFILLVVFVIRLASIMVATLGSDMRLEERFLVGWFGPRGIVAASVAGIMGLRLESLGFESASFILPIVFSIVCLTVLIHGLSLDYVSKILNVHIGSGKGLVISGSSPWSTELALVLQSRGIPALIVDSTWYKLQRPRQNGVNTHYGEIVVDVENGSLDLTEYSYLLAATDSNSYNALVCSSLMEDFGYKNVYQLPLDELKPSNLGELPVAQSKQALDDDLLFDNLKQKFHYGWKFKHTTLTESFSYDKFRDNLNNFDSIHLMVIHPDKRIEFSTKDSKPKAGDTIISFTNQ